MVQIIVENICVLCWLFAQVHLDSLGAVFAFYVAAPVELAVAPLLDGGGGGHVAAAAANEVAAAGALHARQALAAVRA